MEVNTASWVAARGRQSVYFWMVGGNMESTVGRTRPVQGGVGFREDAAQRKLCKWARAAWMCIRSC